MNLEDLKMYLVRNSDGQYYRRVGYGGYGTCWTGDLARASVWTKISVARSRVTYMAVNYPEYPSPDLVVVNAGKVEVLPEADRVAKAKEKIAAEKAKSEIRQRQYQVEHARSNSRKHRTSWTG